MKEKNKKKSIGIMLAIAGIFIVILGISYAFINLTVTGSKQQVISAGNLDLVLDEDENNLYITDALPMYDEVGMIQDAFTFRITNKTSIPTNYILRLEEITVGQPLAREDVKYGLTKDDKVTIDFVSNIIDGVINEGTISGNATIEYSLRLWVRDDLTDENLIKGKSLRLRMNLKMMQSEEVVYKEEILNGAEPVLSENLVPVTIQDDGTVQKANIYDKWYSYEDKTWANAVVLQDKTKTYNDYEVIPEANIQSYFVWIPKYSYKLWDLGNYNSLTSLDNRKVHTIPIKFGLTNTNDNVEGECTTPMLSGASGNCKISDYMTHPAFLAFDSTGFWTAKFDSGYKDASSPSDAEVSTDNTNQLVIKPDTFIWRNINVGTAFKVSYDYLREDESHLMKNTEWGAVAYLQHSEYGSSTSVRVNNNGNFKTGYASIVEPTLGFNGGVSIPENPIGTTEEVTALYNTKIGYTASTTGNISGIYDMSGGGQDYVMGYNKLATKVGGESNITTIYSDFFTSEHWKKYYDEYQASASTAFNNNKRILGDATGEMGPFAVVKSPDNNSRQRTSWYQDYGTFISANTPWFIRGGSATCGEEAGIFRFGNFFGRTDNDYGNSITFRVVLTPPSK